MKAEAVRHSDANANALNIAIYSSFLLHYMSIGDRWGLLLRYSSNLSGIFNVISFMKELFS